MTATPEPSVRALLAQRTASELADALRRRADLLSGEKWEAPATAAMMREAADLLTATTQGLADLAAEMQRFAEQQLIYSCDAKERALAWAARLKALHHDE